MTQVTAAVQRPVVQPSVHVRAVITWIAIFPLVTIASLVIAPIAQDWNPILRALIVSTSVVPVAVDLVVPCVLRVYTRLRAVNGAREKSAARGRP
jgi:antibiotic biosynthesis monooxygenase (ABM) superfamily enzyme